MKEIPLRELMNMADPEAHEGIGELWNQKTIHYLVVFTSADADFELIGAGPTLPYATLEAASEHVIPGKKAEFYVKCPGAIAGRLQPKLAPAVARPVTPSPLPVSAGGEPAGAPAAAAVTTPETSPSLKGRSSAPFIRPPIKLGPRLTPASAPAPAAVPAAVGGEPGAVKLEEKANPAPVAEPAKATPIPETNVQAGDLAARERAITQREQELAALFDSLKIREASLREREAAIAASEQRLLMVTKKSG
jgi:hypothetical protein